jgi:hypothetical protein
MSCRERLPYVKSTQFSSNSNAASFQLLRCNQLWPKSKKLAVTSLALIASSVISAIGAITVALTTSSDNWGDPLGFLSIYTFIALAISVLVSAMIFKSAFQSRHNNISIIGTITESCIVTAATLLAILVYYHRNHRFLIALVPAFAMIHVRFPVCIQGLNINEILRQHTRPLLSLASSRVRRSAPKPLRIQSSCLAQKVPLLGVIVETTSCEQSGGALI